MDCKLKIHKEGIISLFYTQLCVNNIEVTITDVFTVIITKDQSGGIYRTGGQRFMVVSQQTSSSGYGLRLSLFTAINP